MTKYIDFNKGTINNIPKPEKRTRYYHKELKGLNLDVKTSGVKTFYFNYKVDTYNFSYRIGVYPEITPAIAIDRCRELKVSLSKCINPQTNKINKRKEFTFRQFFFERYLQIQFTKKDLSGLKPYYAISKFNKEIIKFEGKATKKALNIIETYNAHMHLINVKLSEIDSILDKNY
jgi:hypothetical protein